MAIIFAHNGLRFLEAQLVRCGWLRNDKGIIHGSYGKSENYLKIDLVKFYMEILFQYFSAICL